MASWATVRNAYILPRLEMEMKTMFTIHCLQRWRHCSLWRYLFFLAPHGAPKSSQACVDPRSLGLQIRKTNSGSQQSTIGSFCRTGWGGWWGSHSVMIVHHYHLSCSVFNAFCVLSKQQIKMSVCWPYDRQKCHKCVIRPPQQQRIQHYFNDL